MRYVVVNMNETVVKKSPAGVVIAHAYKNDMFPVLEYRRGIPYYMINFKGIHAYIPTHHTYLIDIKDNAKRSEV
jgi:hypothetical protein